MTAAFSERVGTSLFSLRCDRGRRLVQGEVTICTKETDAGRSAETEDFTIPEKLASVTDPVELFDNMLKFSE